MAKFSVGEIAWLKWSEDFPNHPPCECTIVGAPRLFRSSYTGKNRFALYSFLFWLQYEVIDEAGKVWIVTEELLHKRPPPSESNAYKLLTRLPKTELVAESESES